MLLPKSIKKLDSTGIEILWNNDQITHISSKVLRDNCPSAVTLAKKGDTSHEKPLSPKRTKLNVISASLDEELKLEQIWLVGNYAIGMRWADGHDSGIYTFDYLHKLGKE